MFTSSNNYLELINKFPPRLIKSEADFLAVQEVIDILLDSKEITTDTQDYLNLLGLLVYEYEEKEISIPDIHGVELLKVLTEEFQLQQKDLVSIFKTESIASEILSGKCKLTVEHIEKLAKFFQISPSMFFPRS